LYYLEKSDKYPYGMYLRGKLDLSLFVLSMSYRTRSNEASFSLISKKKGENGRTYTFICRNLVELREWEEAVVEHMRALKRAKTSSKKRGMNSKDRPNSPRLK
jgi:hypothetical protein